MLQDGRSVVCPSLDSVEGKGDLYKKGERTELLLKKQKALNERRDFALRS